MVLGKLIGVGRTAEVFEWGENKIIKLFLPEVPKLSIELEYNISKELYKKGVPVAEVYEFLNLEDRYGIVYEKIQGDSMLKLLASRPVEVTTLAYTLAELHYATQKVIDIHLPDQKSRMKRSISFTGLLTDHTKNTIYEYIDKLPNHNMPCHGDLHPDNVLISNDKAVIIDWMTATIGNPLSDVARTLMIMKYASMPDDKTPEEKSMINAVREEFHTEYVKHYMRLSSSSMEDIDQWELPLAAARLIEGVPDDEKRVLIDVINRRINGVSK